MRYSRQSVSTGRTIVWGQVLGTALLVSGFWLFFGILQFRCNCTEVQVSRSEVEALKGEIQRLETVAAEAQAPKPECPIVDCPQCPQCPQCQQCAECPVVQPLECPKDTQPKDPFSLINTIDGARVTLDEETLKFTVHPPEKRRWTKANARVAMMITNFNMPERTNQIVEHIKQHVKWPCDIIVVDNGSYLEKPSKYTNVTLNPNVQTLHGWNAGLSYADALAATSGKPYFGYWIWITSSEVPVGQGDILTPMMEFMLENEDAVMMSPALTLESTTTWNHLKTHNRTKPERVWMIDNLAALYRAEWLDSIGRLDRAQTFAWGVDLEASFIARAQGKHIYRDDRVMIQKVSQIGYRLNRMGMPEKERGKQARKQMKDTLTKKFGKNWYDYFYNYFMANVTYTTKDYKLEPH